MLVPGQQVFLSLTASIFMVLLHIILEHPRFLVSCGSQYNALIYTQNSVCIPSLACNVVHY